MKNRVFISLAIIICVVNNLSAQMTFREKYAGVIRHYSKSSIDSLKYKAALYLIDNMDGHVSPEGEAMKHYIHSMHKLGKQQGIRQLQQAWYAALKEGNVEWIPDSAVIEDRYLIENIDEAFESWEHSKWKKQIPFAHFCKYILPYRINDEHIGESWRRILRKQYADIIADVDDIRKAFALVKDSVYREIVLSNPYSDFNLDPLTCSIVGRAECSQRCIFLAAVLRSLGIPAAVDITPMWADYSQNGHGWTSMIMSNGDTYTVFENDTLARQHNPIDASQFSCRYLPAPNSKFPLTIKTEKTPVKVYRMCYEKANCVDSQDPQTLASPFICDVSKEYGLTSSITLSTDSNSTVYLYCYKSARDWTPIAKSRAVNGKVTFSNVGKGCVCIAKSYLNGQQKTLAVPFLTGSSGIEKYFTPQTDLHTITIDRKYPLCSYTTDTWWAMKGGIFEGSMTSDFTKTDTIAVISQMPCYVTTLNSVSRGKYRFLRYRAPKNNRSSLAELQFYSQDASGNESKLTGIYSANGVDTVRLCNIYDENPATICKGLSVGYSITLDLGEGNEAMVSKVVLCPSTDLNFVEKGHLYELYYYDKEWKLINRAYSSGDKLTFHNVPSNTILLLKDRNGGKEERIFEYSEGIQIWH